MTARRSGLNLNGSQLAKRLRVDKATISRLTAAGVLRRDKFNRYDLHENLAAWTAHEDSKQQGQKLQTASAAVRTMLTKEKLRGEKLKNDAFERNLVPHTEVSQDAARCAITLRATLNAAASELAPLLAGAALQAWEIEKLLKEKLLAAVKVVSQSTFADLLCPHCQRAYVNPKPNK